MYAGRMLTKRKPSTLHSTAARWTFLTNHAHVLVLLAQNQNMTIRDMAQAIGITERAVIRIIDELEEESFLKREKNGRQNIYKLSLEHSFRHPIESHKKVKDLIQLITGGNKSSAKKL